MNQGTEQQSKKTVVIVAMGGHMLLNLAGPADVFTNAERYLQSCGITDGYAVMVVSPTLNKKVETSIGISIDCQLSALEIKTDIDTLIIAGNDFRESSQP